MSFFGLGKTTPLTEEQLKYHNTIKGELEELMGTVICHSPIHLWDHDQKSFYNVRKIQRKIYEEL